MRRKKRPVLTVPCSRKSRRSPTPAARTVARFNWPDLDKAARFFWQAHPFVLVRCSRLFSRAESGCATCRAPRSSSSYQFAA